MQPPHLTKVPPPSAPSFYLTGRQPLGPGAILLACVVAVGALSPVLYALGRTGHVHLAADGSAAANHPPSGSPGGAPSAGEGDKADDNDDPSQIDTIYLGDPADAPVPGRPGNHVSPVHPTIVVGLPRFGDQTGLIPDTPAGHLLFGWLAAFNQANYPALRAVLPSVALDSATAAETELRRQTGGFSLLSAKEVQPGVLVFRMRDQSSSPTEVLGTLQVRPDSSPAAIASFSLRAVPSPAQGATLPSATAP